MKPRIALMIFSCFLLVACNDTAQFQTALKQATSQCNALAKAAVPADATDADIARGVYNPRRGELGKIVDCITENDRPVWVKYAPRFIDIYDTFRAKTATSAEEYDKGEISYKKYLAEAKQEMVDFNNDVHARRASIDGDSQQTSDAISSIANSLSSIAQARAAR